MIVKSDLLNAAYELAETGYNIPIDNQLIKDWLDHLISVKKEIRALYEGTRPLYMGNYKKTCDGDPVYSNTIELVGWHDNNTIHIYNGIERIAEAIGKPLEITRTSSGNVAYGFDYKGFEVFQIKLAEVEK